MSNYRYKPHLLRPPFPHLFHSNSTVSDDERALIVQAIDRARAEVTYLVDLEHSEGDTEGTYRRRLACEEFISNHEELLHWARRLPTELFISIFLCCTENNAVIPWNISQVCRKWRFIALSIPQLWRRVHVRHEWSDESAEKQYIHYLKADYLKRSAGEGIVFSLIKHNKEPGYRMFHALLEHAERWGDVALETRTYDDPSFCTDFRALQGRLHSLYSFQLKVKEVWPVPDLFPKPLQEAPRLRHFHLGVSECWPTDEPDHLNWPWQQLTHLTLIHRFVTFNLNPLSHFDNLIYISLVRLSLLEATPDGQSKVIFKACKYLHMDLDYVADSTNEQNTRILQRIHCPVLEHIHISYILLEQVLTRLVNFIEVHSQNLKSLHWEYGASLRSGDTTLAEVLRSSLPQLRVLRVSEPPLIDFLYQDEEDNGSRTPCQTVNSLAENRYLFPSLQKVYIQVHPQIKQDEVPQICRAVRKLVCVDEEASADTSYHPLDVVQLELYQKASRVYNPRTGMFEPRGPHLDQWDILSGLEDWADGLQDGWEAQVRLEYELERVKEWADAVGCIDDDTMEMSPSQVEETLQRGFDLEVTDALVLSLYDLPRKLQFLLERYRLRPQLFSTLIDCIERLFSQWVLLFQVQMPSRRWALNGKDTVVYVPPHSALYKDPTTWMFGVLKDHGGMDYLRQGCLPELTHPEIVS
ncbi:hypothetical protein D9756_010879 [Leucocoprinus leucothites]|uniref:F-box domain-containing protein n=1 Tax=Leucocoprinus leucothites TaxID=201217 RepID=A0A8H5CQ51_9AGAR|nr:hypothetical protein D9756_010879 [Leucoagaricus leucothites]